MPIRAYLISAHVTPHGAQQFVVTAMAVPHGAGDTRPTDIRTARCTCAVEALELRNRLVRSLGAELRLRGDSVRDVKVLA
jgi:hypothetical protein